MNKRSHISVLLSEAVDALMTEENGIYLDGTFGRGGHSREILSRLGAKGRLIALDQDPAAIPIAQQLAEQDPRLNFYDDNFVNIKAICERCDLQQGLSGALLDLGVSSPQLDEAERGFSFHQSGPLDMRMDPRQGQPVADWLNQTSQQQIAQVLWELGEERYAKRIATAIIARRPLSTTQQLAKLIGETVPRKEKDKHPATRSFLALRLFINQELSVLETALKEVLALLRRGGRLVVISFHSLEDRIVKRFIRDQARGYGATEMPHWAQVQATPALKLVGKPIRPSAEEIDRNPRARSAIMRVAEKI
ncbi:MAG TPA: 16S rRNA (cytosine(1402)-N(4))-methyltransferase [Gammaproteobacteria bacterium]|nr:16S rRNA (cytosine(1402)-N(4))-methyltransferase [Gammaproteobacteria bacterium]